MKTKYRILFGLSALILLLDQLTKLWILKEFSLADSTPVIPGVFNLTYIRNPGAAFGILAHAEPAFRIPFFTIVPLIALFVIGYVFKKIPDGDIKLSSALSLVIGGAIGNLLDRVRFDYVVDFLDFHWHHLYHFPAFNVADSAICVGVAILMIDLMLRDRLNTRPEESSLNVSSSL